MTTYTAITGETFSDEDINRWAQDIEDGFAQSVVQRVGDRAWEAPESVVVPITGTYSN